MTTVRRPEQVRAATRQGAYFARRAQWSTAASPRPSKMSSVVVSVHVVSVRRVYLDQFAWLQLSRVHYGKSTGTALDDVLAIVKSSVSMGLASYPLSAAHYQETYRRGDPESRRRLGAFMAEISQCHTIAGPADVLRSEVEIGLHHLAKLAPPPMTRVFGVGYAHAFGLESPDYETNEDLWRRLVGVMGREKAVELWETLLLTGPDERLPSGDIQLPTRTYDQRQLDFERQTAVTLQQEGHSADLARRLVLDQEAGDVIKLVCELNTQLGLDVNSLLGTDAQLTPFLLSLPAKGTISRMRYVSHQNPKFKRDVNDLTDLTALGMAAGYCDIVVAEKHWGALLDRFSDRYPARVIRRLTDLPQALVD